jgi:hypothetical protein
VEAADLLKQQPAELKIEKIGAIPQTKKAV